MKPRVLILNGHFDPLTSCETVDAVFDALHAGQRGWLCTVNVATLMTMRKDRTLQLSSGCTATWTVSSASC